MTTLLDDIEKCLAEAKLEATGNTREAVSNQLEFFSLLAQKLRKQPDTKTMLFALDGIIFCLGFCLTVVKDEGLKVIVPDLVETALKQRKQFLDATDLGGGKEELEEVIQAILDILSPKQPEKSH